MKKIKIKDLPRKYQSMIVDLTYDEGLGFVNIVDDYEFDDGSHVSPFESEEDLIDLLKEASQNKVFNQRLGSKVKDPKTVTISDGIVRIIVGTICEEIFVDPIYDTSISLEDCLQRAKELGYIQGVIFVTFDSYLRGVIYQFGNYNQEHWYVYGHTQGFC